MAACDSIIDGGFVEIHHPPKPRTEHEIGLRAINVGAELVDLTREDALRVIERARNMMSGFSGPNLDEEAGAGLEVIALAFAAASGGFVGFLIGAAFKWLPNIAAGVFTLAGPLAFVGALVLTIQA